MKLGIVDWQTQKAIELWMLGREYMGTDMSERVRV